MDITAVLEAADQLLSENRTEDAEQLLLGAAGIAQEEQDTASYLQILNELLGFYRELTRMDEAYLVADQALEIVNLCCPKQSIPYATTLLNVATVYRTGGRLTEALSLYKEVEVIYKSILPKDHEAMSSLYNNMSLLYQEMGQFDLSKDLLLKAYGIVKNLSNEYRQAVTLANLAGTCVQLGDLSEAYDYAAESIRLFQSLEVTDSHYAAALSALGSFYFAQENYRKAADTFRQAMDTMELSLGKNGYYDRLKENYEACLHAMAAETRSDNTEAAAKAEAGGMELCRAYYEAYGRPAIEAAFPEYADRIAAGLVGEGSDCFGFDDAVSADHDWGPSFCLWVDDEVYEAIGPRLQELYQSLPHEFHGVKRAPQVQGMGRRGVQRISAFYKRFLGTSSYEEIDWASVSDSSLAAAVNGAVFYDPQGEFTYMREKLLAGYPQPMQFARVAQACGIFSQAGQYNFLRMQQRGDEITTEMLLQDCLREAMKLAYYMDNKYPPHDKWLRKGLASTSMGPEIESYLLAIWGEQVKAHASLLHAAESRTLLPFSDAYKQVADLVEELGSVLAMALYKKNLISDVDAYIDHHTEELMEKSILSNDSTEELVMRIAKLEFEAFDKVRNEGGRASCQNDWPTFSIMRRSQYLTWKRDMLLQYLYDFHREYRKGHNLITEKYGRMMESTAPDQYEQIKHHFPSLSKEQQAIIDQIAQIQVGWMEEFAKEYPGLANNARSVHAYEDNPFNTSYETYLRGELGTYSDKMLQMYAAFIVELVQEGKNLAYLTMENSCRLYGYKSLQHAEEGLRE